MSDIKTGWFLTYRPNTKPEAIELVESTDGVEIAEVFGFINTLCVEGDESQVDSLTEKTIIVDIEEEGVGQQL